MGTILVLEDEESVNRGISFTLKKAGYDVISCFDIREAKSALESKMPEIIICDINLPDGNGLDFIKWSRKHINSYIICLTALDQELDQVMGYEAGADDYVTKPFSLSVLLLKIEAYYKRTDKCEHKKLISTGDIQVYPGEMKVSLRGEDINLTKNEWKMLNLFIKNAGQILSKSQMIQAIYDIDGDFVDENTIAVNIRRLREKIESDTAKPEYIKNVRGLGYIWDREVIRSQGIDER